MFPEGAPATPRRYRVCGGGGKGDGEFVCGGEGTHCLAPARARGRRSTSSVGPDIDAGLRPAGLGWATILRGRRLDDLAWRWRDRLERGYNSVGNQIRRRGAEQGTFRLADGELNGLGDVAVQRECHCLARHRERKRARRRTGLALCGLNVGTGRHGLKLKDLRRRRRGLEPIGHGRARTRTSCQCSAHSNRGDGEKPNTQHHALPVPALNLGSSGFWVKREAAYNLAARATVQIGTTNNSRRSAAKK